MVFCLRLFDKTGMFEQPGDAVIVFGELFLGEAKLYDIVVGKIGMIGVGSCRFELRFRVAEAGMDDLQFFAQLIGLGAVLFELHRHDPFGLLGLGEAFAQLLLGTLLHIHVVVVL